ncbi:MAG: DDE-type integrase/transposase/recombinase [Nitrospira sp.]|nr:DDE-type integrase/transposase/recombinase [Nitrospira sp.]
MFVTLPYNRSKKRIYRVYCASKLNKCRRGKHRLPTRHPLPLAVSSAVNACWSADLMSDALWNRGCFCTFNLVDEFNREALAIEVDVSSPARRVIETLDRLAAWRGYPQKLRLDNVPEFVAVEMAVWAEEHREAVRDMYVFNMLDDVRQYTEQWLKGYNEDRPHESLGDLTTREYLSHHHPKVSSLGWC